MHTNDQIEIRLLGPTLVRRRDGEAVSPKEWRTSKSLELVRLLALNEGRPVGTDVVLDRLWPAAPDKKAQASLRTATYHVRLVLGEDAIERVADGLALRHAWTDVQAYAALAAEIELARHARQHMAVAALSRDAEALYVGDLEQESCGDWFLESQQRFRVLRLGVLLAAAESAVALGRMAEALELAAAAAQLEPSSERAVRVAMRAYGALGEIEKALVAYEELRAELADQYGVDPAPQTRALHVELLVGTGSDDRGLATDILVGRDDAVSELVSALSRTRPLGRPDVTALLKALLQGEPASSLVDTVMARTGGRPGDIRSTVSEWLRLGMVLWAPEGLTLNDQEESVPLFPAPSARLLRSLATLEFRAVQALAAVAVIGGPVVPDDVDAVMVALDRRHPMDAERLLTLLSDTGLLRSTPGGYHLGSSRGRHELLAWLRPAELRRLHTVTARVLPMEPAERVRHLKAGGQHQQACDLGVQELTRKRTSGDVEGVLTLAMVLEALPSRMVPAAAEQPAAGRRGDRRGLLASA